MKKMKRGKTLLLFTFTLIVGMFLFNVVDANTTCPYHQEHDEKCGYIKAVEGHECNHEHDETCYQDVLTCKLEHEHSETCYQKDLACKHVHNDDCGYVEKVVGHECNHRCSYCDDTLVREGKLDIDIDDNQYTIHIESKLEGTKGDDQVYYYLKLDKTLLADTNLMEIQDDKYCSENKRIILEPVYLSGDNENVYLRYSQAYNSNELFDIVITTDKKLDTRIALNTASSFNEADQNKLAEKVIENQDVSEVDFLTKTYESFVSNFSNSDSTVATSTEETVGIPMDDYITDATMEKLENSTWIPLKDGDVVNDGDGLRTKINFSFPAGIISPSCKTTTFQLPEGITLKQAESGVVLNSDGVAVGNYTITTDGLITIDFYSGFANGEAISGEIHFQGEADLGENNTESKEVGLGDTTIIIKPSEDSNNYDISVDKTAKLSENKDKIDYEVKVSSEKGTPDTVHITDTITNGTLVPDSIVIKDKDGKIISSDQYKIEFSNDNKTFNITGLPKLEANSSYTVTYSAIPDQASGNGEQTVKNNAGAISGNKQDNSWHQEVISKPKVEKSGTPDATTGSIDWTIKLYDAKPGTVITDTLPEGLSLKKGTDGKYYATLIKPDGSPEQIEISYDENNRKFTYTLPDGFASGDYEFKYTTTVDNPGEPGDATINFKNNVTIKDGDNEYNTDGNVGYKPLNPVVKQKDNTNASDSGIYNWKVTLNLPSDKTNYKYEDKLTSSYEEEIVHYLTNDSFNLKIVDENGSEVSEESYIIKYFDSNNNEYSSLDDNNKIVRFEISFNDNVLNDKKTLTLTYGSYLDYNEIEPGIKVQIKNTGIVGEHESTAQDNYKKDKVLEKYIGTYNNDDVWEHFNSDHYKPQPYKANYSKNKDTLEYEVIDGRLYYMLALRTSGVTPDGNIVVTDNLPAGTKLSDGKYKPFLAFLYGDYPNITLGDYGTNINGKNKYLDEVFSYETKEQPNGSYLVTFTINQDIWGIMNQNNNKKLAICYAVDIEDMTSGSECTATYTNSAKWDNYEDTHTQEVHKDANYLTKDASYVNTDSDHTIQYSLLVNSTGEDLIPGSDYLTLVDKLVETSNQNAIISFKNESLKVYAYDPVTNQKGAEIDDSLYSYVYDAKTNTLTMKLPDKKALVIEYHYTVARSDDSKTDPIKINNEAKLSGVTNGNDSNDFEWEDTTSGASAYKNRLNIYKVDSQNYKIGLKDAKFQLSKYNANSDINDKFEQVTILVSDENGLISILYKNTELSLSENTLYRLREIKAPAGYDYGARGQDTYFVFAKDGQTNEETLEAIKDQIEAADIKADDVSILNYNGDTLYIPNEYSSLVAKKNWVNVDGTPYNGNKPNVDLTLKRTTVTYEEKMDPYYNVEVYTTDQHGTDSNSLQFKLWNSYKVNIDSSFRINIKYGSDIDSAVVVKAGDQVINGITLDDQSRSYEIAKANENSTVKVYIYNTVWNTNMNKYITDSIFDEALTRLVPIYGDSVDVANVTLTGDKNTCKNKFTSNAPEGISVEFIDGWQVKWTGLPKDNGKEGNEKEEYTYIVEETPISGWDSSNSDDGLTNGIIQIINTKQENVSELPETGGIGTLPFILGGLSMMSIGAVFFVRKRHTFRKEGESK